MITAKHAEKEFDRLRRGINVRNWTYSAQMDLLNKQVQIAILSHLEQQGRKRRKPSAYNLFFAKKAAQGLSAAEIAKGWKDRQLQTLSTRYILDCMDKSMLKETNDMLRSVYQVVKRKGLNTNWKTLETQLNSLLEKQHRIMYPEQYTNKTS